jgi:ubiquinone/menaquinone biosynthesis C-methylase UbiE
VTELAPGLHARTGIEIDSLAYDRYTGHWSRLFVPDTIAAASVRQGDKVLDMSTGTGEAAIGLLPLIGGHGTLIGADISTEMARAAQQRVGDERFLPITADGQELPFRNGYFDAVTCQLGLQFYPDPARGLGEFRRVLRPEGIASVCVISEPNSAPIWGFLAEAIVKHLPEKRNILMASFSLSDAKRLEELFRAAGFENVGVKRVVRGDIVRGLDEYWNSIDAGIGSMPQMYLMLHENDRRSVREEVTTKLSRFMVGGELRLSMEMLIGHGQAGAAAETSTPSSLDSSAPIDPRLGDARRNACGNPCRGQPACQGGNRGRRRRRPGIGDGRLCHWCGSPLRRARPPISTAA